MENKELIETLNMNDEETAAAFKEAGLKTPFKKIKEQAEQADRYNKNHGAYQENEPLKKYIVIPRK